MCPCTAAFTSFSGNMCVSDELHGAMHGVTSEVYRESGEGYSI
jgi:hypothetical protein